MDDHLQRLLRRLAPQAVPPKMLFMIHPSRIAIPPWHPPRVLDEESTVQLTEEILARGKARFTPLLARPLALDRYELLAGQTRLEAARRIGYESVPVIAVDVDDATAIAITLTDTLARGRLTPWEEAQALAELEETLEELGQEPDDELLATLMEHSPEWIHARRLIAERTTPAVLERAGLAVHDLNVLGEGVLFDAARQPTAHARARHLRAAHEKRTEQASGALPAPREPPLGPGYSFNERPGHRLTLEIRRPPDDMEPEEARQLLERLEPTVIALRRRAAGDADHD